MTGFWYWLCSSLAVGMVLFYMYCAATPVDTQYYLGLYVMLTYVLIFLNYSFTSSTPKKLGYYIDSAIPFPVPFSDFLFCTAFSVWCQRPQGTIHRRELDLRCRQPGCGSRLLYTGPLLGKRRGQGPHCHGPLPGPGRHFRGGILHRRICGHQLPHGFRDAPGHGRELPGHPDIHRCGPPRAGVVHDPGGGRIPAVCVLRRPAPQRAGDRCLCPRRL